MKIGDQSRSHSYNEVRGEIGRTEQKRMKTGQRKAGKGCSLLPKSPTSSGEDSLHRPVGPETLLGTHQGARGTNGSVEEAARMPACFCRPPQ